MWSRVTAISTRSSIVFTVCHAVVLGFLPLSLLCGLYLKISGIVRHTAQTASELVPIRNRDPFKNIIRSLVIHLTLSCSLWATYLAVRIIEVSTDLNHAYMVFTKLVILIAHPFGEGLLQPSFKKQTEVVHRHIQARSHRRIVPNSNASFSDFRTFIDERSTIAGDWTRPTRGPGRKISDHSSGGGGTGSVFKHRSATNDASSLKSHGKGRKESREDLRKALKLLGGDDPMEYSRIRRLSTSLRFSTTSYPAHDMYDSYSMVNHSPVLSSLRRQMVNNNVCEGYISPDTVIKDFKDFDSDSPSPSRSHRRWKRLLTTARTVKRFSRTRLTSNSPLESCLEEADDPVGVGNKRTDANRSTRKRHTSGSDMDKMRLSNKLDNYASWTAKDSKNNKVDNITRSDALLGPSRQTVRNHVSASRDSTMQTRKRARAISCVNNEWLQHQQEKDKRAQRKESLEETIVIETDQASPLNRADLIRSMSYDAKIRFRVANGATGGAEPERREKRRVSRRQSRYSRHSRGDVEAVDVKATRNECIKRLQDMSEYF